MPEELVPAPESVKELASQVIELSRVRRSLFIEKDLEEPDPKSMYEMLFSIRKETDAGGTSGQAVHVERKQHPFDFSQAISFMTTNPHHSACIAAKVRSSLGLGWKDSRKEKVDPLTGKTKIENVESEVDNILDPLCDRSFRDLMSDVGEDYYNTGNGYIEVVREGGSHNGKIVGLFHLHSPDVFVTVEDESYNYHYEIVGSDGSGRPRRFCRFGDKEDFLRRAGEGAARFEIQDENQVSEVIHFRRPSSLSRWYGFPDWLPAVPSIELCQCLLQHKYDFFLNRGVPEFLLFVIGQMLPKEDWTKIENSLKATIGVGNSYKSLALNLTAPADNVKVQIEKLGMESKTEDEYEKLGQALAMNIVTAHRVPPLLAGILLPGKLAAHNELPNALAAFQILVIGPDQQIFQQTLKNTLANPKKNGGLGLRPDQIVLRTIVEEIDLGQMDTMSRMRQPLASANAQGRDLDDGLKD